MPRVYRCVRCNEIFLWNSSMDSSLLCPSCGQKYASLTTKGKTNPNDLVMGTLTKREYFAAMIIQGLLADENITGSMAIPTCVKFADALIEELNK